ncbi:MAG: hypothetical protein WCF57_23475 [Pyrinomonadaceae bacterium]
MRGSISTHFISEFPDFLMDIVDLIKKARSSVLIFCDIPAYGQFSARHDWIQYSHAIENLKDDVTLELICLDHQHRVPFYHEFLQEKPWEVWKEEPKNKERLERLLVMRQSEFNIDTLTEEGFVGLLEETNKQMIQGAFSRTKPLEIKSFMPAYFWLIDGTDAIFSVPSLREGHTEYGFSTTDHQLIDALRDMKDRYLRRPTEQGEVANAAPPAPLNKT